VLVLVLVLVLADRAECRPPDSVLPDRSWSIAYRSMRFRRRLPTALGPGGIEHEYEYEYEYDS